MNTKEH